MKISREFRFEAAHRLPNLPDGHKCGRLHGHSFRFRVDVTMAVDPASGWTMDFGDLDALCRPLVEKLDHFYLNEIEGLENPTSENLAIWIWQRLAPVIPGLNAISVRETCRNECTYYGD